MVNDNHITPSTFLLKFNNPHKSVPPFIEIFLDNFTKKQTTYQ